MLAHVYLLSAPHGLAWYRSHTVTSLRSQTPMQWCRLKIMVNGIWRQTDQNTTTTMHTFRLTGELSLMMSPWAFTSSIKPFLCDSITKLALVGYMPHQSSYASGTQPLPHQSSYASGTAACKRINSSASLASEPPASHITVASIKMLEDNAVGGLDCI